MKRDSILPLATALLWLQFVLPAAEEPSSESSSESSAAAKEYEKLSQEYESAQREFSQRYAQAKTDEEREKLIRDGYPQPQKFAPRFLELAREHPDDEAAVDALVWVAINARMRPEGDEATKILIDKHLQNDKLARVVQMMAFSLSPESEALLQRVLQESRNHKVQGFACYSLASLMKRKVAALAFAEQSPERAADQDTETRSRQVEQLFERVARDFGDVEHYRGTLADAARGDLFEIRNLAIGKTAPEIEGEDIDGVAFKLSDYRGKVVVLDFWGHW